MSEPPGKPAGPIKTAVRFVSGFEPAFDIPTSVRAANLQHRFAVIQETYRPDCTEMFFDEPLWLCLLAFARDYAAETDVAIREAKTSKDVAPEAFLTAWHARNKDDKEPPAIHVRKGGRPVLCVEPEYWTAVGGPAPYHDSYTYSIYSNVDVGERVLRFLRSADGAAGWNLSTEILRTESPSPPKLSAWAKVRRLFS